MRYYTQQHPYYCGIDLHAKTMYICEFLQRAVEPFLPLIAISVECIFTWYWIADFCTERGIPFVLGHALYMPVRGHLKCTTQGHFKVYHL